MKKKFLFVVMMMCVLGLVVQAETVVTTADGDGADTFIGNDTNKPSTYNYGDYNDMDIRYLTDTRAHIGYVRWDITDIGGMDPTGAQLRLWFTYTQSARDIAVYALNDNILDDNWDESTITYNTAPGFLPTDPVENGNYVIDDTKMTYLGTFNTGTDDEFALTIDITTDDPNATNPLIDVIKADTNNKITLAFVGPTDGGGRQFYIRTKEGVAAETDPNLHPIAPSLVLPADVDPIWATAPSPAMNEVVTSSLAQLSWTNPEPNEPGGTITCDVYFGTTEPNRLAPDYGLEYTLATGTNSNSVSLPSAPDPLTQYYWVVDVHDSTSGLHRGRAWSYNTLNNPPTVDAGADQYVWVDKIELGADADTFLRDGKTGLGDDVDMWVHGTYNFVGYLRFDISAYTAAEITGATLTLQVSNEGGHQHDTINNGRFAVFGLTNESNNTPQDWTEVGAGELTWETTGDEWDGDQLFTDSLSEGRVISLDEDAGADVTEVTPGASSGTCTLTGPDVVSFLQDRANDDGLATFIITLPASGKYTGYGTKEGSAPYQPVLNLTTVTNPGTVDVTLDGTVTDDGQPYGTLAYLWEQLSGPETVTIDPSDTEDTTVTIGTAGTYEFQLTGDDGQEAVSDTVQVYVGTDSCDAAQNVPGYTPYVSDLNSDCLVNLDDFATMASQWLLCDNLECAPL